MSEDQVDTSVDENSDNVTEGEGSDASEDNGSILGKVVEGVVTNITNFGAFVKLENGEEGMVHISEIADEYVTDINNFIAVDDVVKVKVLNRNQKNKLELSVKKADDSKKKAALFIKQKSKNSDFENKISQFLKKSEEKQIDIRRNLKHKQGISKKRR